MDTSIFKPYESLNIERYLIPAPRASFGSKTKNNEKIGLEIELEKVSYKDDPPPYWQTIADGSLKVRGQEFILCCYSNKAKQAINLLKNSLKKSDCSVRTSVHVHLNVEDFNPLQTLLMAYYYMLFETPLIRFSGGRFNNFFCVPLHEWWDGSPATLLRWNKYSAINVLPRLHRDDGRHLSTIEFRQMKGNLNEEYIQNWIDLIVKLKQYVATTNIDNFLKILLEANTTSSYAPLMKEIFKDKVDLLYYPEIEKDIEETISRLKLKFYKIGIFNDELPFNPGSKVLDFSKGLSLTYPISGNMAEFLAYNEEKTKKDDTKKIDLGPIEDHFPNLPPETLRGRANQNIRLNRNLEVNINPIPAPNFENLEIRIIDDEIEADRTRTQERITRAQVQAQQQILRNLANTQAAIAGQTQWRAAPNDQPEGLI